MGTENGQIQAGPRWIKQMNGAHANKSGMNEKGIGIGLIGNFSEENISQAQFDSLVFLVQTLEKYYGIPDSHVLRHGEVEGAHTECPGTHFPWAKFKNALRYD